MTAQTQRSAIMVIRPSVWLRLCPAAGAVVFCLIAVLLRNTEDGPWVAHAFFALSAASVLALVEAMRCCTIAEDESLVIVRLFSTRRFSRTDFTAVTWEKGCPVALQTMAGEWVKLPALLPSGPGVAARLRRWIATD